MQVYTTGTSDYIEWLAGHGYEINTLKEGVLGWGLTVCTKDGYKSIVIKERYLNDWNSGHTIRKYNKLPKVYSEAIN
jgi:hypothetical protein